MGKRSAGKPLSYSTNGDFARRSREQLGLSQAKFAGKCRLSERTIRDIESGLGASSAAIQFVASQLNLPNWHDLLTDRERSRFPGISTASSVPSPTPAQVQPVVNRLFQLPSVVADFTGREDEFRRMVERLRREGGKVGVSALRGWGSLGPPTSASGKPVKPSTSLPLQTTRPSRIQNPAQSVVCSPSIVAKRRCPNQTEAGIRPHGKLQLLHLG